VLKGWRVRVPVVKRLKLPRLISFPVSVILLLLPLFKGNPSAKVSPAVIWIAPPWLPDEFTLLVPELELPRVISPLLAVRVIAPPFPEAVTPDEDEFKDPVTVIALPALSVISPPFTAASPLVVLEDEFKSPPTVIAPPAVSVITPPAPAFTPGKG